MNRRNLLSTATLTAAVALGAALTLADHAGSELRPFPTAPAVAAVPITQPTAAPTVPTTGSPAPTASPTAAPIRSKAAPQVVIIDRAPAPKASPTAAPVAAPAPAPKPVPTPGATTPNRAIGAVVGASDHTVRTDQGHLRETSQLPVASNVVGLDGKTYQPAPKKSEAQKKRDEQIGTWTHGLSVEQREKALSMAREECGNKVLDPDSVYRAAQAVRNNRPMITREEEAERLARNAIYDHHRFDLGDVLSEVTQEVNASDLDIRAAVTFAHYGGWISEYAEKAGLGDDWGDDLDALGDEHTAPVEAARRQALADLLLVLAEALTA